MDRQRLRITWFEKIIDKLGQDNQQIDMVRNPLGPSFPECILFREPEGPVYFGKGSSITQRVASALGECIERKTLAEISPVWISKNEVTYLYGDDVDFHSDNDNIHPDIKFPWQLYYNYKTHKKILFIRPAKNVALPGHKTTSNGIAVFNSKIRALYNAAFELIERDAFCHHWYTEIAQIFKIPQCYFNIHCPHINLCGWQIDFYAIVNPFNLPVVCCLAREPQDSMFNDNARIVGCAANLLLEEAISGSFYEVLQTIEVGLLIGPKSLTSPHIHPYINGYMTDIINEKFAAMLTFNDKVHQEYFQPKIEKIWHDINFMVKKIQYLGQSLYYSEARSSLINELPIQGINYETEASQELLDLLQRSGPSYKQNGAINPLA